MKKNWVRIWGEILKLNILGEFKIRYSILLRKIKVLIKV